MKTIIRYILIVFIVLLFQTEHYASVPDSLEQAFAQASHDTIKIDILNQLSKSQLGPNPDKAIEYAKQAVDLSNNINDKKRLGNALKNVGLGHYYKADFVEVLGNWQKSLKAYKDIGYASGISNLESNIGAVFYSTGDNAKALEHYLRALKISEESGDILRKATVLQNIGAVYQNIGNYDKAEDFLLQALSIFEKSNNIKGLATASLNLGEIYFEQKNDLEKAALYFNIAKNKLSESDDNLLPNAMIFLGALEARKKNYAQALRSLKEAYAMAKNKGAKVAMAQAKSEIGKVYANLGLSSKSVKEYHDAMAIAKSIGVNEDYQKIVEGLIEAYKGKNDFLNVSKYQDSLIKINTKIYDIESNDQMSNLQLSFDIDKKESEIAILNVENEIQTQQIARATLFRNFLMAAAGLLLVIVGGVVYQYRFVKKTNEIITSERNKSDQLLLNILPKETADELKEHGSVLTKKYANATVLFTDFVNFTGKSGNIEPEDLVKSIGYYFTNFDAIVGQYNMEKIKTIGDAYMCVGGLPKANNTNALDALQAAAAILEFVQKTKKDPPQGITVFKIRIGINSGPLVAGVVGTKKFQYDIWGDTVNIASRMEANCEPNHINVSENVFDILKDKVSFKYRGEVKVKNKGKMKMYYLNQFSVN
ncbi:MAG: adenylate/guanylate cyclase domain-containing protein [Saprospiraceae bacterium]